MFLLGIAVRLAIGAGRRPVSFWLILGSIGTLLLGDIGYAIQANGGLVGISGSLQIAWLASHLFASAAALHPSMRHLADRSDMPASRPLGWRWALASGAMLFGPAVLGIENVLGDPRPDIVPIMLAMLVISSLVLARVAGLIGDLRAAVSERERSLVDLGARDRALLDSEGRFRRLVEIAAEGVWLVDPDWRTSFVNPRLAGMLGYEVDEMDGRPVADFVHPEFTDRFLAAQQRRMSGVGETYESCFRHRDGSDVWARLAATPILDADGGFGGAFAMVTDITEERRAELARIELEERLRQSQKMEAIGQLAGGVAHDLNNLLTVIGGHAELLKTSLALHNDAREDLDGIEDGVRRAVQVTRGLLAFARRSHLSPVVVGAEAVVADVVPLLRRFISEAISLEVELEAALPSILVDRSQLQHVILNLVLNARDAMPSGGRLTVAVARVEDPELGSSVEISVRDTGVGIAPERLPHIFEPFYTSKGPDRGTGLGLAIVDGIVAQSGGRTLVTSTPGKGSVFRVRLPVADGPTVQESPGPIHGLPRAQGERILVVEDDDAVRGLLVRWLVHLGYEVSVADGPALGLEMARTTPIDLVISDVIMPGMSGPTMIEQLALHRPGLGVLFVSGYPEHAIFEQSAGLLPTDRLLHKPFSLDDLASAVRLALEGAR